MGCDMCGYNGQLYDVKIEGTIMQVCNNCKGHGEVIGRTRTKEEIAARTAKIIENPNMMLDTVDPNSINKRKKVSIQKMIVKNYNKIIKKARENKNLTQEDLAKKMNIKESLLHNFESSNKKPSFPEAEKLEKFLNIKLTEEYEEENVQLERRDYGELTLGDMIKIKKKK